MSAGRQINAEPGVSSGQLPKKKCCINKGNPEKPYVKQQRHWKKLEQDQQRVERETLEIAKLSFRKEFDDKSLTKAMHNEIGRLVGCAKAAQRDDLDAKRERLRAFLGAEDEAYEAEFRAYMGRRLDEDIAQRKERLLALKRERDAKIREFVEQKNVQKMMSNCQAVRPLITQQLLEESKQAQLAQIRQRDAQRATERDVDQLWLEVARRQRDVADRQESSKRADALLRNVCVQEELRQQIADRAERRRLERSAGPPVGCCRAGELPPADPKVEEDRRRRLARLQHASDLLEQAAEQRRLHQEADAAVRQLEASIMATCRREMAAEETRLRDDRRQRRQETLQYLDYLKAVGCEQKASAQQLDGMIEALNRQLLDRWAQQRCDKSREQRAAEKQMHAERWQQIEERRVNRCNDCNERFCEAIVERELALRNVGKDREEAARRLLRNVQHARELLRQAEQTAKDRAELERLANAELTNEKEDEEACERLAQMYIRGETDTHRVHPHTRELLHAQEHTSPT